MNAAPNACNSEAFSASATEQMPDEQIMTLLESTADSHFECCLGCCGNKIKCAECSTLFATDQINSYFFPPRTQNKHVVVY